MQSDADIFFVFGAPKSGTTWVQMLLAAHPEIFCRSEDKFDFFIQELPKLLTRYNSVLVEADEKTARQGAALFGDADSGALFRTVVQLALAKGRQKPGARLFGAKDNGIFQRLPLYLQGFPQARFVHVLRDPRDVAVSSWFHNQRVDPEHVKDYDLAAWALGVAEQWQRQVEALLGQGAAAADRLHWLRYEDLAARPAPTLAALLRFLGAAADDGLLAGCLEQASFARLAGAREAGSEDRGSFYRKGQPGDWRNHLDPACAADIAARAGPVLSRLGYETEPEAGAWKA